MIGVTLVRPVGRHDEPPRDDLLHLNLLRTDRTLGATPDAAGCPGVPVCWAGAMANIGIRLLEKSFGRPSGPLGRVGGQGHVMIA